MKRSPTHPGHLASIALAAPLLSVIGCGAVGPQIGASMPVRGWEHLHRDQLCAEDSVRAARVSLPEGAPERLAEACGVGDDRACSVLGVMYEIGRGMPLDPGRAARLFAGACQNGNLRACVNLGRVEGGPFPANYYFEHACEHGSAEGCFRVGLFRLRAAVTVDERELAAWFLTRSCAAGYSDACFELGMMRHGIARAMADDAVNVARVDDPAGAAR